MSTLDQQMEKALGKNASRATGEPKSAREAEFRPFIHSLCMADVPAEEITWLWPGRFPFGKLTVLAGDPGLGKSWLSLDVAARLSTGVGWPDERKPFEPGTSIIVSGEDDPRDTLRPRLEKAGADLTRIHCVSGVQRSINGDPGYLSLGDDIQAMEDFVSDVGARLLVVDPVACFLGDTNSHRDSDVRAVLGPLSDLANRTRCCVLAVSHLSKSGQGQAQYRVMGSLAFIAAARIGWLVAKDPDNEKRRLMLPLKANIIEDPQGIAFEIRDGMLEWDSDPVTVDADTVLSADAHTGRTERNEAATWLREQLAHGPVEVPELKKSAEAECVGWRTVERAKKQLGIVSLRKGYGKGSPWSWQLPSDAAHTPPTDKWRPLVNDPENAVSAKDRQTPEGGSLCGDGKADRSPSDLTASGLTPDRGAILVLRDRKSRTDDPDQRAALQAEIDGIQAILAKGRVEL